MIPKDMSKDPGENAYFPELKDFVTYFNEDVKRGPVEEAIKQLQETFLKS